MRAVLLLVSAIVASASALSAREDHQIFCGVGGISDAFDKDGVLHHICDCPKGTEPFPFFDIKHVFVGKLCAPKRDIPKDGKDPKVTPW